jgi:hypothetical protein
MIPIDQYLENLRETCGAVPVIIVVSGFITTVGEL